MFKLDRQQAILEYLKEKHSATVSELSRKFFISETSIRRDLTQLERSGFIMKSYGGAILVQGDSGILSLESRQKTSKEGKAIIAQKAASLINNGDVIFLDSSSTALAMTPYLTKFANLSVITHGIKIAAELAAYPQIRVYCAGGLISPNIYSCSGAITCKILRGMHANKCFVSPKSVHLESGIFCSNEEEAAVRHIMIKHSEQAILLCNTVKLSRSASFYLCGLDSIHTVVCDRAPEKVWLDCFESYKITCL